MPLEISEELMGRLVRLEKQESGGQNSQEVDQIDQSRSSTAISDRQAKD